MMKRWVWKQNPMHWKKEDWKNEKGTHPSEVWNFLSLGFCYGWLLSLVCSKKQLLGQRANVPLIRGSDVREHVWETERMKQGRRKVQYEKALASWLPWVWWSSKKPGKLHLGTVHGEGGERRWFIHQFSPPVDQGFAQGVLIASNFWVLCAWVLAQVPWCPTA